MSFSSENGYIPETFNALMNRMRVGVNAQFGTSYTEASFVGTNFYKFYYPIVQELQASEVKTSEIFAKLQNYFAVTNEELFRPASTPEGIIDRLSEIGYVASVRPMVEEDAGEIAVCVDVDDGAEDYAEQRLSINTVLKNCVVGGVVCDGDQTDSITLSNGQSFDFSFNLPSKIEPLLRLTITLSENNMFAIDTPEVIKERLLDNIEERYRLGLNFEPQKYFTISDAPWAAEILLEYSVDEGENWSSDVIDAAFDDLYVILLENVSLIEG